MRLLRAMCWVALAALSGCSRTAGTELAVPGGGLGLLLELQHPGAGALESMVALVQNRLVDAGVRGARVEALGEGRLRVLVPGIDAAGAERLERLLTLPARLDITLVDPGREFFEGLASGLPQDGSIRLATDRVGDLLYRKTVPLWFLVAGDEGRLRTFLTDRPLPPGRRTALLRGRDGGSAAYLVVDPPAVQNPLVVDARVFEDEASGETAVGVVLAKPFMQSFAKLVRENLHRPLAILVDSELRSLPVITSRIERGEILILPSPVVERAEARLQAEALALSLRAWALAEGVRLVERRLTPMGSPISGSPSSGNTSD